MTEDRNRFASLLEMLKTTPPPTHVQIPLEPKAHLHGGICLDTLVACEEDKYWTYVQNLRKVEGFIKDRYFNNLVIISICIYN